MKGAALHTTGKLHGVSLRVLLTLIVIAGTCVATPFLCFQVSSPSSIIQSQRVLYRMMDVDNLEQVGFFETHPDANPSDFVAFIETEQAAPLWPPATDYVWSDGASATVRDKDTGRIMRPEYVDFVPLEVDPQRGQQLVYIPDDENRIMRIECYDDPDERPTATLSWDFPTVGNEVDLGIN